MIVKQKPKIIISDYNIDHRSTLDLIPLQRQSFKNPNETLFILTTANTSQVAVAKSAEEEVDAYMVKPFTGDILRDTILRVAALKKTPSDYTKAIEEGKTAFAEGNLEKAEKCFSTSLTLNNTPSLGCYYLGKIAHGKKAYEESEKRFLEGLNHQRIHYKCFIGLYEVLTEQKKFIDSYAVLKRISSYYPANPQRLTELLRLAIFTQNYEDIEKYHRNFVTLKQKDPELIRYIGAALVICGKHYLNIKLKIRALDLFKQAMLADLENMKMLKEILSSLLDSSYAADAHNVLEEFLGSKNTSSDYQIFNYLIEDRRKNRSDLILMGQEMIEKGLHDPIIYRILAKRLVEGGLKPAAKKIVDAACSKWPGMKTDFDSLLTNNPAAG